MFFKILILILILVAIYYFFRGDKKRKKHYKESEKLNGETMIECCKCGVFVTLKDAIIKDGKYFCNECSNVNS
jgi:uncharacterized protein